MSPEDEAPEESGPAAEAAGDEAAGGAAEAPVEPDAPRDEAREALRDRLAAELGEALVDSHIVAGSGLWVRVAPEAWRTAGQAARDVLGCHWFDFLSAIDWLPSPYGRYEDDGMAATPAPATPPTEDDLVTGYAGGEARFQVFARVVNVADHHDVVLKVDVPEDMTLPSWVPLYHGADWHERETWEMFGITFDGHPGLRHIYLPGDFEGNPLRKDFPLVARMVKPWPGIVDVEPMPEEPEDEAGEDGAETADAGAEVSS